MNEFGYTKAQGIELLDKLLLPKGYKKVAEKNEPKWFKIYDCEENDCAWVAATITLDLEAFVKPVVEDYIDGFCVNSYSCGGYEEAEWVVEEFITIMKEASKEVSKDLDEIFKVFQETFVEKKPDNIYTLVIRYTDYGEFDEDGLPGVETTREDEYDSLEEALKEFYTCLSFNDGVELYRGNKEITYDVLEDESLFKTYYNNEETVSDGDFKYLTYDQAWECIKEYTEEGYSKLIHDYVDKGIIR